jgi:hypothetical protein
MSRESEAWETNVGGPFVTIAGPNGDVGIWSVGEDRFRVQSPSGEQMVDGHAEALQVAHDLAEWQTTV